MDSEFYGIPIRQYPNSLKAYALNGILPHIGSPWRRVFDDFIQDKTRIAHNMPAKHTSYETNDAPELIGTGAIKYDKGKPGVFQGLVNYFPRALNSVAEVSTFGASKYAWNGWQGVDDGFNRYRDALFRHSFAFSKGEEVDPDSQLLHLAHEAWNSLASLELYLREKEIPST